MPSRPRAPRPGMYNTPTMRNGGFGVLQVEAVTNRPLSIARRHLAASTLRMREIEPHELSSSEWVRFLVMEGQERERWMTDFTRRRRNSAESNASSSSTDTTELDRETAYEKAEEAAQEAEEAAREERRARLGQPSSASSAPTGTTPPVVAWARHFGRDLEAGAQYSARRPRHVRRAVEDGESEGLPTYESAVRARTPPPAYQPRNESSIAGMPRARAPEFYRSETARNLANYAEL